MTNFFVTENTFCCSGTSRNSKLSWQILYIPNKVDDYNVKEGWEVYTVTSVFKSESNKYSGDVVANNIQMKQLETPISHGQIIANDPNSTSDIKLLTSLKDVTNDDIIDEIIGIVMNLILIVMKNLWLRARDAQSTLKCLSR